LPDVRATPSVFIIFVTVLVIFFSAKRFSQIGCERSDSKTQPAATVGGIRVSVSSLIPAITALLANVFRLLLPPRAVVIIFFIFIFILIVVVLV